MSTYAFSIGAHSRDCTDQFLFRYAEEIRPLFAFSLIFQSNDSVISDHLGVALVILVPGTV
jgi:hypothetical protein